MTISTLIAAGRLEASRVARIAAGTEWRWLDEGDAAEVDQALGAFDEIDVIQRPDDFAPRLFLADMDSTMIGQECIDELAAEAGVGDRVADITERAMRGELDFKGALRERLALLEGLDSGVIDHLLATRIVPNPGARTLVQTLKAKGVRCVLVSGGFTAFADVIGERLGFDRVVSNRLGISDGKLTGKVEGQIVDGNVKLAVLEVERAKVGEGGVIAIGDGANDLPMLEAANLGVAYRAKPRVAAAADARIDYGDLTALLWGLGIPCAAWVTD
ncbi:phosphoserine phosphatase SerB [Sphingomicrobium sediminis]|uniref:Phosphoserine phosphatase n=1 Tax=Sphingomicrobium sediminis TaxID=2950949 RepID=A0A9X2J0W8_9SPHN|nr:phosphoserine phosphatase SerB [Sphingomicrobium sediminis]MCM8556688.1 phosphoserine phosphatase SerB [Sphingomicrobium sediminis]